MKKNRKRIIIASVILLLLITTIGYASINSKLNINGNTGIKENSWIIYFDDIRENDEGVTATTEAEITNPEKTRIDFGVHLDKPGDFYEFDVDIRNDGSIDAAIDEILTSGLTDKQKEYIFFNVKYTDGTELKKCDLLPAHGFVSVRVNVTFDKEIEYEMLPLPALETDLYFEVTYVQASNTCGTLPSILKSHKVIINPNGGEYDGDLETTLKTDETLEIKTPTREGYNFLGWEVSEPSLFENNIITMGSKDITLTAKWEMIGEVVARINDPVLGAEFPSVQAAIQAATTNDTVYLVKSTEESPTNNKKITLNLYENKLTGKLNNSGNITIVNGEIENTDGFAVENTGTLTLGVNDGDVSIDSVRLIGTEIGLEELGNFNFYDGFIEGIVGINGDTDETPEEYDVFVDHNNIKDCQRVYLVENTTRAVAKTLVGGTAYYFNLQDAINTVALKPMDIFVIRDFEGAYTLNVQEGKSAVIDIKGFEVQTGYSITNNGTMTIKDSGNSTDGTKGILKPSLSIENNGTLNIQDIVITETTANNVIDNTKTLNITNSTLTALAGYAINNTDNGNITMDNNTYLYANSYALHNLGKNAQIKGGNVYGMYNDADSTIEYGNYYNKYNYAIFNNKGKLTINDINLTSTQSGISNNDTLEINGGIINCPTNTGIYQSNQKNIIINNGTINAKIGVDNYMISTLTMNNGTINATKTGVLGGNITMNNGNINVTGTTDILNGYTSSGNIFKININGGIIDVTTTSNKDAYGLNTYADVSMSGGKISAKSAGKGVGLTQNVKMTGGEIYGSSYGIECSNSTMIAAGTIEGGIYGIYFNGLSETELTIGNAEDSISISTPRILGELYGIYIKNGIVNFYDGILIGKTAGYYGLITTLLDGTKEYDDTEEIKGEVYQSSYLTAADYYAKVGNTTYNSITKAIEAIETTGTIEITKDCFVKFDVSIPSDKNITLDLAGYTYTITNEINNLGTLTIIDTSASNTGKMLSKSLKTPIKKSGTLKINRVQLERTNTQNYFISNYGTLTIDGTTIISSSSGIENQNNLTIKDINMTINKNYGHGIDNKKTKGELTIVGGTINAMMDNSIGIENNKGLVTFNNGTVNAKSKGISNSGEVYVNGGEINSDDIGLDGGTINFSGGTINAKRRGVTGNNITMTGGTINVESEETNQNIVIFGINNGKLNISGGTINVVNNSTNSQSKGIGIQPSNISTISNVNVTASTYALYCNGPNIDIISGTFDGGVDGIYLEKTSVLTIGVDDDTVSQISPKIVGGEYGLYAKGGTAQYYDGVLKGQLDANYGIIAAMPSGYTTTDITETIQGNIYQVKYLSSSRNYLKIGTTEYNSLSSALDDITIGTIELFDNGNEKSVVTIPTDKNIILDLKGYEYTFGQKIVNNGTLTIMDSSTNKTGNIQVITSSDLIENFGTLTIENAKIDKIGSNYIFNNSGTTIINNGILTSEFTSIKNTGTMEINNIDLIINFSDYYHYGIDNRTGNLTINGGTITSDKSQNVGIENNNGTITMNGGTIKGNRIGVSNISGTIILNNGTIQAEKTGIFSGIVKINGGNVNSEKTGIQSNEIIMTGGRVNTSNDKEMECTAIVGKITMSGGEIYAMTNNKNKNAVGISLVNIGNPSKITGGKISAGTNGISLYNTLISITGGTIEGGLYGVYSNSSPSSIMIGEDDNDISSTTPEIIGGLYGVYIDSGTFDMYDGILKGKVDAHNNTLNNIAPNSIPNYDTEEIDGETYKTCYLIKENYVVMNKNIILPDNKYQEYKNIQTAIEEASSGDQLEMIDDASIFYDITIPENKEINLDTKGFNIFTSKPIINNGILKITDSSNESNNYIKTASGINLIINNHSLIINDINIINISTNSYAIINKGTMNLDTINLQASRGIKNEGSNLNINELNIITPITGIENYGNLVFENSIILGSNGYGIYYYSGSSNLTMNNSSIESDYAIYNNQSTIIDIDKSNFVGKIHNQTSDSNIDYFDSSITGTIFNNGTILLNKTDISESDQAYVIDNRKKITLIDSDITFTSSKIIIDFYALKNSGESMLTNVNINSNNNQNKIHN